VPLRKGRAKDFYGLTWRRFRRSARGQTQADLGGRAILARWEGCLLSSTTSDELFDFHRFSTGPAAALRGPPTTWGEPNCEVRDCRSARYRSRRQ
jgi:hypothetical protein